MKHTILGFGCLLLMGLSWQVGAYDEDDLKRLMERVVSEVSMMLGYDNHNKLNSDFYKV